MEKLFALDIYTNPFPHESPDIVDLIWPDMFYLLLAETSCR